MLVLFTEKEKYSKQWLTTFKDSGLERDEKKKEISEKLIIVIELLTLFQYTSDQLNQQQHSN